MLEMKAIERPRPSERSSYIPISLSVLCSAKSKAADLFLRHEQGGQPRLFCRAGCYPDVDHLEQLRASGVESLYIQAADFDRFCNSLLESFDALITDPLVHSVNKFVSMQLAVAVALEQALRLVDCRRFCALAEKIGSDLVSMFGCDQPLAREMFRLARHDRSAFSHVTNVAGYCVILARRSGIEDLRELRKIATAAVLHDIGKRFIPASILAKTTNLTPDEKHMLTSHPRLGYCELCDDGGLEYGQLMMVYQHHEHVDGSGYPVGVVAREIHPWARMLAIVDVFDNMTVRRPANGPPKPDSVLEYLRREAGKQFDGEFVECWISAMNSA